jgi:hypothetical protein
MLHQTLSKGWCRHGSGLLLGLIVRPRGRLVEVGVLLGASENRSARPAQRLGGHDACDPRAVAPLPQREGLLALRFFSPAPLLPEPLLPEPVQPQGASPRESEMRALQRAFARGLARPSAVYRVLDTTLLPAMVRVRASEASKGLFAGQASFGRSASKTEWVYGFKVALVVDPEGVVSAFGLAPAASDERPIGEALIAEDLHEAYLAYPRALRASSGSGAGFRNTGRWWPPPRTTIPAGRGRRRIVGGHLASARS